MAHVGEEEAALVRRAQAGEADAVEELFESYQPDVYRFALRMCGHPEDAREVLQETLLAAYRTLGNFRGEARVSTWLYQIARSFCIKQRRPHRDVRASASLDELDAPGATPRAPDHVRPDEKAHAAQVADAISAAMSALPPAHREALVLRDVEGLTAEEAAEVVGIEVRALKSRLHRARLELRSHLQLLLGEQSEVAGSAPCPALAQELAAYAGDEIDQTTCELIERHLAGCASCQGACDALKRTVSLCRRIPGNEVPHPVRQAVRQALRQAAVRTDL